MNMPEASPEEFRAGVTHALLIRLGDAGKTKIQKLLYFLQEAYGVPLACRFYLHHYGPYSEEVDATISNLRLMGYVDVEPDPDGYGFHVTPSSQEDVSWAEAVKDTRAHVDDLVQKLGEKNAWQLELTATIHYVATSENLLKAEVLSEVQKAKPRFNPDIIANAYDNLVSIGLLRET